jgi:hypothetical protein
MSIDVSKVVAEYYGQWVAYADDRKTVIASGKTAKAALERARAAGYEAPILARIPSRVLNFIGGNTMHHEVRV